MWDVPFLETIFDQQMVANITNTPLYASVKDDKLVWTKENNGEYSVRSAYRFCMQELIDTSELKVPGKWDLIWKLKVPPKVKNFMWRIARNVLPTRMRLRDKRVNCPSHCVLCNAADEDRTHLFFTCHSSSNIWNMSGIALAVNTIVIQGPDCSAAIFQMLKVMSAADSALFACILWSIWKQRNNKVWNDINDAQSFVLERAISLLSDWEAAQRANTNSNADVGADVYREPSRLGKWSKPSRGRMKCNIDASFPNHVNNTGIGICIRDEEGAFVLAKTEWFSPKCHVHIGEALGLLKALQWVHELNLGPIDFELDSKKVVDSFTANKHDVTEFGAIIADCKILFSQFYENSSVEFVRRQANEVAHELAKAATLSASFQILVDPPSCIEHILINEML